MYKISVGWGFRRLAVIVEIHEDLIETLGYKRVTIYGMMGFDKPGSVVAFPIGHKLNFNL